MLALKNHAAVENADIKESFTEDSYIKIQAVRKKISKTCIIF